MKTNDDEVQFWANKLEQERATATEEAYTAGLQMIPILTEILIGDNSRTGVRFLHMQRRGALIALAQMQDPQNIPLFEKLLHDSDKWIVTDAVRGLSRLRPIQSLQSLRRKLSEISLDSKRPNDPADWDLFYEIAKAVRNIEQSKS